MVERAAAGLPAPTAGEEAEMVANGGVYAIELLAYDPDYPAEIAVACIQALACHRRRQGAASHRSLCRAMSD